MKKANDLKKIKETAKGLVDEVIERMDALGVNRLGPVYLSQHYNQSHGTQTRLHIDGDEYESDLVYARHINNSHSTCYEFGDFDLPYIEPDLETVMMFLDSIDEINEAIDEINNKIDEACEKEYSIK